ncbi:MAG TPA: radical SAM protein [Chitinophagales bacterium]|nr:radical SAM protein [Chitinophagales bacterium]
MRNILLLEPNYKNKYPPIGLMKISTYHKMIGDKVTFYKGDLRDLIIDQLYEECLKRLRRIDKSIEWQPKAYLIKQYIKTKKSTLLEELNFGHSQYSPLIEKCLLGYSLFYRKKEYENHPMYDRVYVTTLFTFYWKITIEAIHFAKKLVKRPDQLLIGGVMASLLTKEIETETGIKPIAGLLDQPGILDKGLKARKIIIDNLPLDYSILDEIDYVYPAQNAYFTFMTKGCTRKCSFCSVPKLEPTYKPKIETLDKFKEIKKRFGEQRNLLLMDNNVLASPQFPEIIEEIKRMGFNKDATFIEPNQLKIAIRNLRSGYNDKAYVKRSFKLIHAHLKRLKNENKQKYYDVLRQHNLLRIETTTKENLLKANTLIKHLYEKYRSKAPRQRIVDFNQGTDARYVTEELMKLMSEIPIQPLRIAFDYIGLKKIYINAVELAAKYGIKELSNYILYNFHDTPDDLYERLQINLELGERLGIHIYSFPMKFIPLFGEAAKDRNFVSQPNWNKKFIRAIQAILNVTKGIVAPGRSFFEKAFGADIKEFRKLLYMPETYIIYRHLFEKELMYTPIWEEEYLNLLNSEEREEAENIIKTNDFTNIQANTSNPKIQHFLRHYTIPRGSIDRNDLEYKKLKKQFDRLIKRHYLTLTYDFEALTVRRKYCAVV